MPVADIEQFTHSHLALDDGAVIFRCSDDIGKWPWLALPPWHPIVVQTINFWASIGASVARKAIDPDKWTALTRTRWTCGDPDTGHATHGIAETDRADGAPGYRLTFFDAKGDLVYRMSGEGVVFQNRDFEAWREGNKQKLASSGPPSDFAFAPAERVGAGALGKSFISALVDGPKPSAQGLITEENGFPPANPYLSGSGDHVNATHLAEVGMQFAALLRGQTSARCIGGEMRFDRFVELDSPFGVEGAVEEQPENAVSLEIQQGGRVCTTVSLRFA